ncbi:MAG: capsid cement protein [Candidatus Contendobacter sp.]
MAIAGHSVLPWTCIATAPIAARRFVSALGTQATPASGAIGVSRTAAAEGEAVPVDLLGVIPVEAGAAVDIGASVAADADGRAIEGAGLWLALSEATAAGETLLIAPSMIPPA